MMCGRAPFILDYKGGDGLVTKDNYKTLESCHFNGSYTNKKYTVNQIIKEIQKNYNSDTAKKISQLTYQHYSTKNGVKKLIKLYQKTISLYQPKEIDYKLLSYVIKSIHVTRLHTFSRSEERNTQPYLHDTKIRIKHTLKQLRKNTKAQHINLINMAKRQKPLSLFRSG
jgi:hypothetical protein